MTLFKCSHGTVELAASEESMLRRAQASPSVTSPTATSTPRALQAMALFKCGHGNYSSATTKHAAAMHLNRVMADMAALE